MYGFCMPTTDLSERAPVPTTSMSATDAALWDQLVGRPFHDHHVFDLAATIESLSPTIGTFET